MRIFYCKEQMGTRMGSRMQFCNKHMRQNSSSAPLLKFAHPLGRGCSRQRRRPRCDPSHTDEHPIQRACCTPGASARRPCRPHCRQREGGAQEGRLYNKAIVRCRQQTGPRWLAWKGQSTILLLLTYPARWDQFRDRTPSCHSPSQTGQGPTDGRQRQHPCCPNILQGCRAGQGVYIFLFAGQVSSDATLQTDPSMLNAHGRWHALCSFCGLRGHAHVFTVHTQICKLTAGPIHSTVLTLVDGAPLAVVEDLNTAAGGVGAVDQAHLL